MFSALQNNSPIFVLDKGDELKIRTGQVQSVSIPQPVFGQPFGSPNSTIDIVANIDGEQNKFQGVPASLSVAHVGGIILCETREAMSAEVENLQRESQQVVASVDYHKKRYNKCTQILKELNPQFAKEQAQEEKIAKLEDALKEMKSMLAAALNQKSSKS